MSELDITQLRYMFQEKSLAWELHRDFVNKYGPNANPAILEALKESYNKLAARYAKTADLFNNSYSESK